MSTVTTNTYPNAEEASAAISKRSVMLVFAGLLLAMFMSSLDQMIVSTALPTIVGELGGVNHMMWVTTAYLLAMTITMPAYGKVGDLVGRKGLFVGALVLFLIGSVVSALSVGMMSFIVGRTVQGLGGGGLMVLSQAIIADIVPPRFRGRYMGVMGAVFTLNSVLGPIVGGWFTSGPGWRWAFWINVPLGILAIVSAIVFLPSRHQVVARPKLDVLGMVMIIATITSIVLISTWGGSLYEWSSPQIIGLVAVAVTAGALFVFAEKRAEEPVIPLHLFANRNFNLTVVSGLFLSIAMFGTISYMPTYLQIVEGLSPTAAGYLMIPASLGIFITATGSGFLAARTGRYKWMPVTSCLLAGIALMLLSSLELVTPLWMIGVFLFLFGLGVGLGMQILVLVAQNEFSIAEVGTVTSTFTFFREIGASLGSALVGSFFTAGLVTRLVENLATFGGTSVLGVSANSLTPEIAGALPDAVREAVALSYNEAFTPVLMGIVPLLAIGFVILVFLKETPLRMTNEPIEQPVQETRSRHSEKLAEETA